MFEQKKKMSNAKFFALVVSIGLHVVIFLYLGKMALEYALPKGEVTSYEMEFSKGDTTVESPTPVEVIEEKAAPAPIPPPVPSPAKKTVTPKARPTPPAPKIATAMPTKEISESSVEDQQGSLPVATEVSEPAVEAKEESTPTEEPVPATEPIAEAESEPTPAVAAAPIADAPTPDVTKDDVSASGDATPAMQLGATAGVQSDTVLVPFGTNKPISYPTMARFRKLEGVTIVHYIVSASGAVTDVQIMQSSGHAVLDNQAVDTIKNWKFKPSGKDGVYERPIRYSLKGDAKEAPSQLRRLGK